MTAPNFGGQPYVNQESRALSSIEESQGLNLESGQEELVRLLQTHDYQIKFLAGQARKTMQGLNEATQNPIQQLQQFVADIVVLLGGGELADGLLDFGDLQYILPVIGALFGFGDGPFPISLFEAAEKFFLGYVVPTAQFTDVINNIITAWAGVFGIDKKFVKDVNDLVTAIGDLFGGIGNLFPSLNELFSALGISSLDLGPLGQLLAPIINLFTGIDLSNFGNIIEFITDAIDPWIVGLTAVINWINSLLAVLGFHGGNVVNDPMDALLAPFEGLINTLDDVVDGVRNIIETLIGTATEPIAELAAWVAKLPLISDLVEILTGTEDGDLGDLGTWANNIKDSILNAWLRAGEALTNLIFPHRIPTVSLAAVSDKSQNLLTNPDFSDSGALDASADWAWDGTQDHTGTAGSGSVKAVGFGKYLLSNAIDVNANEPLSISAWVKYSGITAAASQHGIRVSVVAYSATGAVVSTTRVASVASPTGSVSWTQVSGTYTVPSSGVESIRIQLGVTTDVSAGTVWFDDLDAHKTGINSTTIQGIYSSATTALTNLGALVANLLSAPAAVIGAIGNLLMDGVHTVQDFLDQAYHALTGATGGTVANVATGLGTVKTTAQSAQVAASTANTSIGNLAAVLTGGWTVQTLTASGTWTNPGNITQMWVVCFGGGATGGTGGVTTISNASTNVLAAAGGVAGDYVAQQINPASLPPSVTYTIGQGNTTSKTATSFGTVLSTATSTPGYVGSPLGYAATASFPGAGGNGAGWSASTVGPTTPTYGANAFASFGGAPSGNYLNSSSGTVSLSSPAGAGGAGITTGSAYCGGSGGGGGGGVRNSGSGAAIGGTGGAGGFPGGGGGGGGVAAASNTSLCTGGPGGAGGNGVIFLIYQQAHI